VEKSKIAKENDWDDTSNWTAIWNPPCIYLQYVRQSM
jgi:hypothetical protein